MIIDCHAHLIPPSLLDAGAEGRREVPDREAEPGRREPRLPVRGVEGDAAGDEGALRSSPAASKWMDENGIDRQVVGGWLDMMGNELPAEEGERWNRMANEHMLSRRQGRAAHHSARRPADAGRRAAAAEVLK